MEMDFIVKNILGEELTEEEKKEQKEVLNRYHEKLENKYKEEAE